MSLISIAIVKYSAQNCLNAVVNTELFAYRRDTVVNYHVKYSYAVKQDEMDDDMVVVNLRPVLYVEFRSRRMQFKQ